MTRIRLFLFSDPPSCQSSLHLPLPVRLHSLILCALTHVFTIAIGEKYVYVGCIKNYI